MGQVAGVPLIVSIVVRPCGLVERLPLWIDCSRGWAWLQLARLRVICATVATVRLSLSPPEAGRVPLFSCRCADRCCDLQGICPRHVDPSSLVWQITDCPPISGGAYTDRS